MHRNPEAFADLLESAADDIGRQERHPGQSLPGVWNVGGANSPEQLIGVVATAALARVCRARDADLDSALASYVEVAKNISVTPQGGPDVMAAQHMRDAAKELRRRGRGGHPKRDN